MKPLVSICIPTYNGEQFIIEALESAFVQTYNNLEIIVSDDASNDNTLQIIGKNLSAKQIPIHIYNHTPNGIGANWNNCIKKANGKYIKFLFQDDILLPNCIEEMVDVLEKESDIMLLACKREFLNESNIKGVENWINTYKDLQKKLALKFENKLAILDFKSMKDDNFFQKPYNKIGEPTTVLFKKELINAVGYFREDFKQILDYEFYNRMLFKNHRIAVLDKVLVYFRLHNNQATNINKKTGCSDYELYDEIIYKEYFWKVNRGHKLYLLKKYNLIFRILIKIKRLLKF